MVWALIQRKSVQSLRSPDFFQTRTKGEAKSLLDFRMSSHSSISFSTSHSEFFVLIGYNMSVW